MIKKLFLLDCFDYKKFILNNLKKLSLSPNEAVVLITLMDEISETKKFSISSMEEHILLKRDEIENILGSLLERGFYSIYLSKEDGLDEERVSLDGFFLKASHILEYGDENKEDELYSVSSYLSETLNRMLTDNEIEILKSLVLEDFHKLEEFKKSVKKLEKRKNITFKLIISNLNVNDEAKKETPAYVLDFLEQLKKHE